MLIQVRSSEYWCLVGGWVRYKQKKSSSCLYSSNQRPLALGWQRQVYIGFLLNLQKRMLYNLPVTQSKTYLFIICCCQHSFCSHSHFQHSITWENPFCIPLLQVTSRTFHDISIPIIYAFFLKEIVIFENINIKYIKNIFHKFRKKMISCNENRN